ncbi:MAG TPA: bifunctional 4-hydroxy-2-oxoglutarate aldolase/2-dehydro-3-deoxy-phosphogluconate aldolase [Vicinamibacterales bacterium]|nr:bifunctional 4-hydroxy-2-oxoglutarate aldolase/2-dehydro-3-deoxy-phosphogluconate aldolase [Vicinamibacterales bacterium]
MSRTQTTARIEREGIVAVIRLESADVLAGVVDALAAGGVRVIEVTMTVPGAIAAIGRLASSVADDVLIGAGTVLDPETARRAIDAGARFVVSPVFRPATIAACHALDVPAIPGCYTPTEILNAWEAGADIVKVFPANGLGPSFLKDVRAPLPQVKLMPTGGVSIDNAGDWLRAGAVAVGVGGALVDARLVAAGDLAALTGRAARIVANVRAARLAA